MQLLGMLMPLLSLVAFVGWVWLVIVAFRSSTLWGFLVLLFSPITAIIFAIKNWDESRKPFMTYIGAGAASFAIAVITILYVGAPMMKMAAEMNDGEMDDEQALAYMEDSMDRLENSGMLDAEEKADLDEMRTAMRQMQDESTGNSEPAGGSGGSADAIARRVRGEPSPRAVPAVIENRSGSTEPPLLASVDLTRDRELVRMGEIDQHVGERLRIVMRDGTEFTGRYVQQDGGELEFERRISAGTIAVYMPKTSIRSLHPIRRR